MLARNWLEHAVNEAQWRLAAQKESELRKVAAERLPTLLRWTVDRPRILRLIYRVRPAWRPTIYYGVDGDFGTAITEAEDGTIVIIENFRIG